MKVTYDDFLEHAREVISENEKEYFDGYTAYSENDYDEAIKENEKDLFDDYIESIRDQLPKASEIIEKRTRDHNEKMFGALVDNGVTIVRLFRKEYNTLGFDLSDLKENAHVREHRVLCQYDLGDE